MTTNHCQGVMTDGEGERLVVSNRAPSDDTGPVAIRSTVAPRLQRNLRLVPTMCPVGQASGAAMKKFLLTSTALMVGGQAFAADLPVKAPRIASGGVPVDRLLRRRSCRRRTKPDRVLRPRHHGDPVFRGCAVAAAKHRADRRHNRSDEPDRRARRRPGRVRLPVRDQLGHRVAGDFSFANIQGQGLDPFFTGKNGGPITLTSRTDALASATGRIGYAFDHLLIYGKGGVAWARDGYSAQKFGSFNGNFCSVGGVFGPCNPSGTATRWGWTAAGIEWAFARNWSAFAEYDHYGSGQDHSAKRCDCPGRRPHGRQFQHQTEYRRGQSRHQLSLLAPD